jgi:hypothetical protein
MSYDDYYSDPYYDDASYYTPEQLAMMQQMMAAGTPSFDPMMGMDPTMTGMFGGMAMPQMDTKGRVQPYDLGVQTQLTNFGQDIGSSIGNNMMAYMAGPGSYAPGALDPVYDEKPLNLTQGPQLQMLSQSGGIRGTIADLILGGMNAGQAAARVRQMLKNPEKYANIITPAEAAQMRSELDVLPADPMNGVEEAPDYNSIGKIADSIYSPYLQEQGMLNQPNVRLGPDGQYVQVAQRDSPQMEWLKKMGLPDPRASYDVQYALESDPTLVGMLNSVASTQAERDMMRTEFEDRLKRTKKYRDDDVKNKAADAKQMERYYGATKQAMADYFGAASRGQAQRPEMPGAAIAAAMTPEQTQQAYNERNREGTPDWLGGGKSILDSAKGLASGVGDYASQTLQRVAGRPIAPRGAPNLPTNIGPLPNSSSPPATINGVTLELPDRPLTSDMTTGMNPEGYSMMDQILGRPIRDVANYNKRRKVDEAISPASRAAMYMAAQKNLDQRGVGAMTKYMLGLAPTVVAGRQGRSPRTDAIQQRLAPLYQIGALGQRA